MSPRHTRLLAMGIAAILAVLTAAATALAGGSTGAVVTALVGALASAGAAVLVRAGRPAPATVGGPALVAPPRPGGPDPDRVGLVRACIYVRDRLTSSALAERLDRALREAGVCPVEPMGERFDPARHEAGGTVPAPDAALIGTVAAVEAPGYTDRGVPLRPPVVTVYQGLDATTRRLP
jgi:hypothetical protein